MVLRGFFFRVDSEFSLMDYTRGDMDLRLLTAIDFTVSNPSLKLVNNIINSLTRRFNVLSIIYQKTTLDS